MQHVSLSLTSTSFNLPSVASGKETPRSMPRWSIVWRWVGVTGVRTGGMRQCRGQPVLGKLDGNPGRRPKNRASAPQSESCDWWTRRRRATASSLGCPPLGPPGESLGSGLPWEGGAPTKPTLSHT